MSYVVFARKYRPKDFDEVIGQEHITTTLKNAIKQNRVAHAYIFSGPRGIGKTTTARILAKALNCEKGPTPKPCNKCILCQEISSSISMDVIEIDGASNRGIDEVRQLRENVKFAPTNGKYKLYIIDEVHMLTQEAFNALLKTLEEPPPHVKFIFATTHPNKVIPTILSRCQRFDFRRVSVKDIVSKLKTIAKLESIKVEEETLFSIARQAEGSLRDAESILDQLSTFCNSKIGKDDITRILGTVNEEMLEEFTDIIAERDAPGALAFIDKLMAGGKDLSFFMLNLIGHFRNLMVANVSKDPSALIDSSRQSIERVVNQTKRFSTEELFYISDILLNAYESMKRSTSTRVIFELAVIKITKRASMKSLNSILEKIKDIEKRDLPSMPEAVVRRVESSPPPKEVEPKATVQTMTLTEKTPSTDVDLAKIQEIWPTFLKVIKTKKMSVASYLLEGSPLYVKDGSLCIGFPKNYSLHKEALESRENKDLIEAALKDILRKELRVSFITQDTSREDNIPASDGKEVRSRKEPAGPDVLNEPMIQSALEVFDGRIVKKTFR